MSDLTILDYQDKKVINSRQVSEMTSRPHNDLMKSIRQYCEYLNQGNFSLVDFFIESTYEDFKGETRPCYLLTRKGCDMVANKMTGEKGVLFTAAYVTKFEEMEKKLAAPMSQLEILAQAAQALLNQEKQLKQIAATQAEQAEQLKGIRDVVALSPNDWRKDSSVLVHKMAIKLGGNEHIRDLRTESYKLLNERFGVSLEQRLTNKRRRMADEGVCKSKRDKLTYLDVIGDDKKLIEGYIAIVKEMTIKYGA